MRIDRSKTPHSSDHQNFVGAISDLRDADVILDGQFVIIGDPRPSKHDGKPALQVRLGEWRGAHGALIEIGRLVLPPNQQVHFTRYVGSNAPKRTYEAECVLAPPNYESREHARWQGPAAEIPECLWIYSLSTLEWKRVIAAYPNGLVLYSDGTAFQSHPDRIWTGWVIPHDHEDEEANG